MRVIICYDGEAIKIATTKAGQKAVNKYMKNNYDRINFTITKGMKEVIADEAKKHNESTNGYIKRAVKSQYKADTGKEIEL